METSRLDHEPPLATDEWGWKYHHMGIPTDKPVPGEVHLKQYKFYVAGFSTSPFGIEWMRFEKGCTLHKLIQTVPHVAFEVKNIEEALSVYPFHLISNTENPSNGVRSIMIEHNGAPIELIEFSK